MQTRSLVFLALAAAASAFTAPAMGGRMQLRSSKAGENALRLPCGLAAACRPHRCRCALRRRPRPGGAAGRRAARRCSLRQGGRSFPENVLSYCRAGSRAWTRSLSSDPTPTLPQGIRGCRRFAHGPLSQSALRCRRSVPLRNFCPAGKLGPAGTRTPARIHLESPSSECGVSLLWSLCSRVDEGRRLPGPCRREEGACPRHRRR